MKLILSVIALISFQLVFCDDVERAFAWKNITYENVKEGTYKPEDIIPTGVTHDAKSKKLYFGIPRLHPNIPYTLAELDTTKYNRSEVRSPPLSKFNSQSKEKFTSIYQPVIDDCRRLWVLDVGKVDYHKKDNEYPTKNPEIIAFDLNQPGNPEVHRYELTGDVAQTPLGFGGFAVDVINPKCTKTDETYVYITNFIDNTLIVYDMKNKDAWKFKDDSFKPDLKNTAFTHHGKEHPYTTGIFGIALGDRDKNGHRSAYYLAGSSTKLYNISTASLKEKDTHLKPTLLGERGFKTEAIALAYDPKTKVIFFVESNSRQVSCWNTQMELKPENTGVIYSNAYFVFGTDIMVDTDGILWFMANGHPPIDEPKLEFHKRQIRLMEVPTHRAIRLQPCEMKKNKKV
uniref:43.9 kDa salivary yellow-related protein n=1 Tax=Phlebotomus sergenti TaxID=85759 RepID=F6K8S5_9DIPT